MINNKQSDSITRNKDGSYTIVLNGIKTITHTPSSELLEAYADKLLEAGTTYEM